MKKTNFTQNRNQIESNPNSILITETYELPRYTPRIYCADWECDFVVDNIKENCQIWTPCRDYRSLSNFELDDEELTGSLSKDLEIFESKVGENYKCFVLGAYIHSGTSFSLTKGGDHRCRFDSSQLGFIAIPKDWNEDEVASDLTAAWEGEFMEYQVIDELTGDCVDSITTADLYKDKKYIDEFESKYGVDFSDCEVIY